MEFGITADLKSTNTAAFKAGIQKGFLTSVKCEQRQNKKDETAPFTVLVFSFVDLEGARKYDHVEWVVNGEDAKAKDKVKASNVRIKHIFESYLTFPTNGIGVTAKSWEEYFNAIVKAFETMGKDGKPIFKTEEGKFIPIWLKFTYFNNKLGFPYSPNFIEKIKEGKETTLAIDKRYDIIEQTDAKSPMGGHPGLDGNAVPDDISNFL